MKDLSLGLQALRQTYAEGTDPVAVVDEVYARIAAANDPGIFITLLPQEAAQAAARALGPHDGSKPLWGIPFAVKDNIDVAGLPTTAACPAFAYNAPAHAFAVAQLIAAGAICIGKTNLDQFATGLVGVRTPYPIPRNTFDADIPPGGSSSGSGVAVAAGLVSFALGTDTAGSGRVPAALNNIVGLKPSVGAVSIRGLVPACKSIDCISVFARSVDDAWEIYRLMAAADELDPFQHPLTLPQALPAPPPELRVGVPRAQDLEFFGDGAAEAAWDAAMELLAAQGASFTEIDMRPFLEAASLLYDGPWVAERHAAMRAFMATNADDVLPVTRGIVEGALRFSATDAFDARYRMTELAHATRPVWGQIDLLCVPSIPGIPTLADLKRDPLTPNARLGRWTNFVNLLDLCALAVPGPFRSDGLPAGVTLIAPHGQDDRLAGLGRVLHARARVPVGATGQSLPPAKAPRSVAADEIEVVVVGAHLSGMALNGELAALDARFLRAVATEPNYRLYALTGGPPRRPGLLRVAPATGHAIATEVWAMSAAAFGRFVASIPAPLGFGTIELADGTRPKGFLVEPEGLVGAEEISRFGGWRGYIASVA
jgi:allophanate hydrolase